MTEAQLSNAMDAYGSTVYRLALTRMHNIADAEDVYQEVFLRLWKQAAEDWDGDRAKAWLIRTTITTCIDMQRDGWRSRVEPVDEQFPAPQAEDPAEVVEATAQAADLLNQVNSLTPACRTAIYLHYYEGYTAPEIAQLLGRLPSTVNTQLRRGREQLKTLLEKEGYP